MLIGIISDTHDQVPRTTLAVNKLKAAGVKKLFHCGDLVQPTMMNCFVDLPGFFVFGNNDNYFIPQIKEAMAKIVGAVCLEWGGEIELAGKRIAMTHGHLTYDVKRLMAAGPDYLLSGHSHIAGDWREGKTRRINPGALHRATSYSVALLNLESDELQFIEIPR